MDYSTCSSYIISKDVTCKYDGTPVALDHEGGNILEFIVNVSVIKFCVRIDNLSEKVSSNPGVSNALFKLYESLFVIWELNENLFVIEIIVSFRHGHLMNENFLYVGHVIGESRIFYFNRTSIAVGVQN